MRDVRLLDTTLDLAAEIASFTRSVPEAGAVASFTGKVRPGGGVEALELSHYAPLTLPSMEALVGEAYERWELMGVLALHRVGLLLPGEPIVLVATASTHRRAAFESCDFLMDHLKSKAWFWKREQRAGEWHWIEPRAEDHSDRERWSAQV